MFDIGVGYPGDCRYPDIKRIKMLRYVLWVENTAVHSKT